MRRSSKSGDGSFDALPRRQVFKTRGEWSRKPISIPVPQPINLEYDSEDACEDTHRLVSDRLSRDSMAGLVQKNANSDVLHAWNKGFCQNRLLSNADERKTRLQQQVASNKCKDVLVDASTANTSQSRCKRRFLGTVAASPISQMRDDSNPGCSTDSKAGNYSSDNANKFSKLLTDVKKFTPSFVEAFDISKLLQIIFQRVYGTERQRLLDNRQSVESNPDEDFSKLSASILSDPSESMTLTGGDLTETQLTQLYRQLKGQRITTCQRLKKADTPVASPATDHRARSPATQSLEAVAELHAAGQRGQANAFEAMALSDRVANVNAELARQCDDTNTAVTIFSTSKYNDPLTEESKVNFNLMYNYLARPDCHKEVDNRTKLSRHQRGERRIKQRLLDMQRSPTICESVASSTIRNEKRLARLQTSKMYEELQSKAAKKTHRKHHNDDGSSCFTAILIEWDDQKRRAMNSRRSSGSKSRRESSRHSKKHRLKSRGKSKKRSSRSSRHNRD